MFSHIFISLKNASRISRLFNLYDIANYIYIDKLIYKEIEESILRICPLWFERALEGVGASQYPFDEVYLERIDTETL